MLRLTYQCDLSSEFYRLPESITTKILSGALASLGNAFAVEAGVIVALSRLAKTQKIKPGRVLARLLDAPEQVQKLAALLVAPPYHWTIITGPAIADYYHDTTVSSCMTHQDTEVFDLYVKNPNQLGLCVMHDEAGDYLGRTLVYLVDGVPRYHSRRLYMNTEHSILTREHLNQLGIIQIPSSVTQWPLEACHHERYPYLDDFAGVDSDGLTEVSPEYTCDQTTGYCREYDRTPCDHCGDLEDTEDLAYLGEGHHVCSYCLNHHYYRAEDHRGNTCIFHEGDVNHATLVDDGELFADIDDCFTEDNRVKSDFSDLELIRLSDDTMGTAEELQDAGYVQIGDYWTTEARSLSDYVVGDGWWANRNDRLDY